MRLSTAKDWVLYSIVQGNPDMTGVFGILPHEKNAALKELADEGYISVIEISVKGSGPVRKYVFQSLYPKGEHFVKSKQRFRKKAIKKWIVDFPKNYWILILLAGSLGFNIKDVVEYFQKKRKEKSQIELPKNDQKEKLAPDMNTRNKQ